MFIVSLIGTVSGIIVPWGANSAHAENGTGESVSDSARPLHWGIGGGTNLRLTGGERTGWVAAAELLSGGRFDRFGIRLSARGDFNGEPVVLLGGLVFEAGTARPRLNIIMYGEAGASVEGEPSFSIGVQTNLAVFGPLGVGFDANGTLIARDTESTALMISAGLLIRLAR